MSGRDESADGPEGGFDLRAFLAGLPNQPGVYRVECYIQYMGAKRAWIFSNPIYLR